MSEKRFECVFIEDDEFGGTFRRLKDNETNITYMVCDVVDLLNFQNTQIKILKEENEQLRKDVENLQEVVAELGATLLINGFEIEINGENLSELIDDE